MVILMANQLTAKVMPNEQASMGTALDALKGTLAQTKLANSNFGPNDSTIGSAVMHPVMAFDKALEWLQTQVGNAAGLPQQQDEASMYQMGALPQAQANAALNVAGTAQLGSMPMAPMGRGGTLGTVTNPKALYRGSNDSTGTGISFLGKGKYSTTDKNIAKQYGNVEKLTDAYPSNPLKLNSKDDLIDFVLNKSGKSNIREFNREYPDIGEFIKSMGYDGVHAGNTVVKYDAPQANILQSVTTNPIIGTGQRTDVMVGQPANSFVNGVPTSGRDIPFNVPTQDVRMREYVRGKYKPEGMFNNEVDQNKLDFLKGYRGKK
jgi:hypothetical protein